MSARDKGNRARRKAIAELEEEGWLVDIVEKTGKFVKVKDCFGLFDLLCVKANTVLFVQVTSNRPHTHKEYKYFAARYCGNNMYVAQWVWIDRKGFKKFVY